MSDAIVLEAPIRRVTLLEDRAQVRRQGALDLPAGSHRLRVEGVSPVVGDRSLVVRIQGGDARVDEARVVRWRRVGARELPVDVGELERQREELARRERSEKDALQRLRSRRGRAEHALSLTVEGIGRELPEAARFEQRWADGFATFARRVREAEEQVAAGERRLEELERERERLEQAPAAGQRTESHLAARIELEVTVRAAGRFELSIDYMVPCALWRPIHRATLRDGQVALECDGAVWQATGEEWRDVELAFSTARPTQRAEPPRLTDDPLRVRRRQEKKVAVSVREQAIATTGEGQARVSAELPGVDDGGETRTLGASRRATIPADGCMHRVPIFEVGAAAAVDRICRPERSPLVHVRSRQANEGSHPLLAGPLELVRESGTVGRGELGFVAPGERFVIGWGADDAIRVHRQVEEQTKDGFLGRNRTRTRTVTLRISNLEPLPVSFRLEERIPVSEVEAVTVELDAQATKPAARADEQGIVAWDLELSAHGHREVTLVYAVTAGSDVTGI